MMIVEAAVSAAAHPRLGYDIVKPGQREVVTAFIIATQCTCELHGHDDRQGCCSVGTRHCEAWAERGGECLCKGEQCICITPYRIWQVFLLRHVASSV